MCFQILCVQDASPATHSCSGALIQVWPILPCLPSAKFPFSLLPPVVKRSGVGGLEQYRLVMTYVLTSSAEHGWAEPFPIQENCLPQSFSLKSTSSPSCGAPLAVTRDGFSFLSLSEAENSAPKDGSQDCRPIWACLPHWSRNQTCGFWCPKLEVKGWKICVLGTVFVNGWSVLGSIIKN